MLRQLFVQPIAADVSAGDLVLSLLQEEGAHDDAITASNEEYLRVVMRCRPYGGARREDLPGFRGYPLYW